MSRYKGQLRYVSVLILLILFALLLLTRLLYLYVADPVRFPIHTIKISASYQHVTHEELQKVLDNYLDSSFFSLSVTRLYTELVSLPWVNSAQVERVWPDVLKITLVEKVPIAIWNNAMLSIEGDIFSEVNMKADNDLPRLKGPANHQHEVLQVYQKMSKILALCGLRAAALKWRKNEAWELLLTNGIQLQLGKRDLETRVNRFCRAFPAVFAEKYQQLASVDLRYPRGMAVQWKNETEK